MANVVAIKQNPKKPENGFVTLDDGQDCWTPSFEKAQAELHVGAPLPQGWEITQGDYGPRLFPPKDKKSFGGGAAAFRNTKEGQAIEQEGLDRRTAVMQATVDGVFNPDTAAAIFAWLRSASAVVPVKGNEGTAGDRTVPPAASPLSAAPVDSGGLGRSPESTGDCPHTNPVFTRPTGGPVPEGKFYCPDCRKELKG